MSQAHPYGHLKTLHQRKQEQRREKRKPEQPITAQPAGDATYHTAGMAEGCYRRMPTTRS